MKNQYSGIKTEDARDSMGDRGPRGRTPGRTGTSGRRDSSEGMDPVIIPSHHDTPATPPDSPGGTSNNPDPVEHDPFTGVEDPGYGRIPESIVSKKSTH